MRCIICDTEIEIESKDTEYCEECLFAQAELNDEYYPREERSDEADK